MLMNGDETRWLDATDQAALVRCGEVTAVELVEAAVSRVEALDRAIGAVPIRWFDAAVEQAGAQAFDDLLFGGVPTLLKDLHLHERGRVLTNGNLALRDEQPVSTFDAELVVRMRRAGLVTLGRSTSSELGTLPVTETAAYGPTLDDSGALTYGSAWPTATMPRCRSRSGPCRSSSTTPHPPSFRPSPLPSAVPRRARRSASNSNPTAHRCSSAAEPTNPTRPGSRPRHPTAHSIVNSCPCRTQS